MKKDYRNTRGCTDIFTVYVNCCRGGGCGYDGGRRSDYVARSQDMLAAGRVAAAGSALAAHGVDLSDTASLQLALHGAGLHGLHALDDVAQVSERRHSLVSLGCCDLVGRPLRSCMSYAVYCHWLSRRQMQTTAAYSVHASTHQIATRCN